VTQYGWKQKIPAAVKSTSFLHLATIGYLSIAVQGTRAVVKLYSNPYQASAYVMLGASGCLNPFPMKPYFPAYYESPQCSLSDVAQYQSPLILH